MKIGIDLDDVSFDYINPLIQFHNEVFGTNLTYDKFHSYKFWEVWGGTREEAIDKAYQFHETEHFKNMKPLEGAIDAIKRLKEDNELYVITSRQNAIREHTIEKLEVYFPNSFEEEIFTNQYSKEGKSRTKKEVCEEFGIERLIEDSADYANECQSENCQVYLFNRPWNIHREIKEEIIRVDNWKKVLEDIYRSEIKFSNYHHSYSTIVLSLCNMGQLTLQDSKIS